MFNISCILSCSKWGFTSNFKPSKQKNLDEREISSQSWNQTVDATPHVDWSDSKCRVARDYRRA